MRSTDYDDMEDAEPIYIDGIPYMVMGHAQFYTDSRIIRAKSEEYNKFIVNGAIDYNLLTADTLEGSGLSRLLQRYVESLGYLWRMVDEYDRISSHAAIKQHGKYAIPESPQRAPSAFTPGAFIAWAKAVGEAVRSRGIRVPTFRYPTRCTWVDDGSPPSVQVTKIEELALADATACRYVECLERVVVYSAQYLSDLEEVLMSFIGSKIPKHYREKSSVRSKKSPSPI